METERIKESLASLRDEIEHVDLTDARSREKLTALVSNLERKLEEPDEEWHADLLGSVKDAIEHLGNSHPNAVTLLNNIMVSLSKMGI